MRASSLQKPQHESFWLSQSTVDPAHEVWVHIFWTPRLLYGDPVSGLHRSLDLTFPVAVNANKSFTWLVCQLRAEQQVLMSFVEMLSWSFWCAIHLLSNSKARVYSDQHP